MKTLEQRLSEAIRTIPDFPKKGISFKDLQSLLCNHQLTRDVVLALATRVSEQGPVDAIIGLESRGFLFGTLLAYELNVPFVMVRKPGKLPPPVVAIRYEKEYGSDTLEINQGILKPGTKVHIHDDLLATGGSLKAAIDLARQCELEVSSVSCIIELEDLKGKDQLDDISIISMVTF